MNNLQSLVIKELNQENYSKLKEIIEKRIEIEPETITNYYYLGLVYLLLNDIENADDILMSILLSSNNFDDDFQHLLTLFNDLALNQFQHNNFIVTVKIYGKIHQLLWEQEILKPEWGLYYYHFALALEKLQDKTRAMEAYKKAININPSLVDAYNNLGNIYCHLNQWEKAELIYQEAIKINPNYVGSYFNLLLTLKNMGKFPEALNFTIKTADLFPENFTWQLQKYLFLPIIYSTEKEIINYRQKFTEGLDILINNLDLLTEDKRKNALEAITNHTNFYLAYQGYNDLDLQKKYAYLVTKITEANLALWSKKRSYIREKKESKIRLGFVCGGSFNRAKWLFKWLENLDQHSFVLHVYFIENLSELLRKKITEITPFYYCIPDNLKLICEQIYQDNLDILTYTEIGMLPQTLVMGSLRLAPIQCATIGHPLTSGLETIDYYISRELMEMKEAQNHYSEKLFLLPNIGMCLEKEVICEGNKIREDFYLNSDNIVYLCSQMLFKYLPHHDYLFAEIGKKVPKAKFVFIQSCSYLTDIFKERLDIVFKQYNLDFRDYCVFLPSLSQNDYFNLNLLADVFLDSLAWSGDNTTREAVSCNLPVVTLPLEFMRSRHSYGILKMLGVTETIANSEREYIQIAVKLGQDQTYNQTIREKIKVRLDRLYHDLECVKALEKFYLQISS